MRSSMIDDPELGEGKRDWTHATSVHEKSFVRAVSGEGQARLTPHLTLLVQGGVGTSEAET